jgi:glucose-6-phosphate-specific signal transduction histidine kinase
MNDLTILTNTQLGEFISLSLIHGTNTQFSYELLHEVAERLVQTDEIIKAGISNGIHETLTKQSTAFKFRLEDVVKTLDETLAPAIIEDNKETVESITDIQHHEAMNKAMKVDRDEGRAGLSSAKKTILDQLPVEEVTEQLVEQVAKEVAKELTEQVKPKTVKKKEPPVEVELEELAEELVEVNEPELLITSKLLKEMALELRQRNAISKEQIVDKLTELDASSTMTLAPKHYAEFYNFLESFNV